VTIDSDVFDVLTGIAGAGNVFPDALPLLPKGASNPLPAITYLRVSTQRVRSHEGDSMIGALYQCTCWDATALGARALGREVAAEWASRIGQARVENEFDHYDPGQKLYARIVDVRVWTNQEEAAS
jgi:hypothetical protein